MGKLLRLQDRIILSLAFIGDTAVDSVKLGAKSRRSRWVVFPTLLPWEESNFLRSYEALIRTKDITKEVRDGKSYIVLSSSGKDNCERRFPLLKWCKQKWNREWCVVSYDIPENKSYIRDSLRKKLKNLGFGLWQRSVYISPFSVLREDLLDFVRLNNLEEFVSVSVAKDLSGGKERELASKVFKLDKLRDEYDALLFDLRRAGSDKTKYLYDKYLNLLVERDSLLPVDLFPENWIGFQLISAFKSILKTSKKV